MPKQKTKRVLAKKIKVTKTGKLLRSHQLRVGHLKRHKSGSARRRQKKTSEVSKTISRSIRRMLGRA